MALTRAAAIILGAACATLLVTSCGSTASLRTADVEQQIAADLSDSVGGDFAVTCPSQIPAEVGYAFTCSVEDRSGGTTVTVTVVEDDDQGAFTWKVSEQGGDP